MLDLSGLRGFLSERRGQLYRVLSTVGVLALLVGLFLLIGNGVIVWRVGVDVVDAQSISTDRLLLIVRSCNKNPEVSRLRESDVEVEVRVVADIHPFLKGGQDCLDTVEVQLKEPLGNRSLVDTRSGQTVSVR